MRLREPKAWRRDRWRAALLFGVNLAEIGRAEGVSGERVRQVVGPEYSLDARLAKAGISTPRHGISRYQKNGCRCAVCRKAMICHSRRARQRRIDRAALDPSIVPHGLGGYKNWNCRCSTCKAAGYAHYTSARAKAQQRGCPPEKHGTRSGYGYYGCRCPLCRSAHTGK